MDEEKITESSSIDFDVSVEITEDDRQLAMMCHILGFLTGFFTPLVYCLVRKGDSNFLQHHEIEAFNFQMTMLLIWGITVWLDVFVFNALFVIPVAFIIDAVYSTSAVLKARDRALCKYPISIPFIITPYK